MSSRQNKRAVRAPPVPQFAKAAPKKRKVLDEDTFVSALERLIQRDFFPNLESLRRRSDMLEALERKDFTRVRELAQQGTPAMSDAGTPSTLRSGRSGRHGARGTPFNAPSPAGSVSSAASSATQASRTAPELDHMSLNEFLSKFTNEDSVSFEHLLDKDNAAKRQRYWWMFEDERRYNERVVPMLPSPQGSPGMDSEGKPVLLLEGPKHNNPKDDKDGGKKGEGEGEGKGEGESDQGAERPAVVGALIKRDNNSDRDRDRAGVEKPRAAMVRPPSGPLGCKHTALNPLMFGPQHHVGYRDDEVRGGPDKVVNYHNTRFASRTGMPQLASAGQPDSDHVYREIDQGLVNRPNASPAHIDLDDLYHTPAHPSMAAAAPVGGEEGAPRYGMVATPSPAPTLGDQSPMITWGDIGGTPLRLNEDAAPYQGGPVFQLAEPTNRERKALELSSSAQARMRKRKQQASTPSFSGALSPAGRLLLARSAKSPAAHLAKPSAAHDAQLRRSYRSTPSPAPPHAAARPRSGVGARRTPTPASVAGRRAPTPKAVGGKGPGVAAAAAAAAGQAEGQAGSGHSGSVTDNLLNV